MRSGRKHTTAENTTATKAAAGRPPTTAVRADGSTQASPESAPRSRRGVWLFVAVAVLAGLAGVAAWVRSLRHDPEWEPVPTDTSKPVTTREPTTSEEPTTDDTAPSTDDDAED